MKGSTGRVLVSQETLNRAQVIGDLVELRLSRKEASLVLNLSERQVSRMSRRFRSKGILGLEHRLIGKAPPNQLDSGLKQRVLALLKGKYSGFNLKHFHEQLIQNEKIQGISYSSVKRLANEQGLGRVKRRRSTIRKRRKRFAQEGYLLQMDGSHHYWWKGQERCLIAGIDDATSDVPYGEFFETESLEGYMRTLRKIIEKRGIPRALYVDKASWLGGISKDEGSQFVRMCDELGVKVIYAHSAEAKGRVERLWGTLQDRLVSELRLNGIQSITKANEYFNQSFLTETWSKKFTVQAASMGRSYLPTPREQELNEIFCLKFERKIRKDHTLLFANEVYGVTANLTHSVARKHAEIRIYLDGTLKGYYGGKDLELRQERKGSWGRHDKPLEQPGLTTWLRVLKTDLLVHSAT